MKIQPQSIIKGKANAILPNVSLNVRDSHGIFGPKLDSVLLGQEVTLDVAMEEKSTKWNVLLSRKCYRFRFVFEGIYDFFVHSCYASDGKKSSNSASVMLVDQKGLILKNVLQQLFK